MSGIDGCKEEKEKEKKRKKKRSVFMLSRFMFQTVNKQRV